MKTVTLKKNTTAKCNLNPKKTAKELDVEINAYYRKLRSLRCRFDNSLNVSPNEANYLLSGHCTELIDMISVRDRKYTEEDDKKLNDSPHDYYAKIYGVVAANQSKGRYCYIYLHFERFVIKCWCLEAAYSLIPTLKECCKLSDKISKLLDERKISYKREKKLKQKSISATKSA